MSDLIERLRTIHATATMREAADEIERLRSAEHDLSAAYVRLRQLIPGALNTPTAPSPEQVWDVTEHALRRLAEKAWMYDGLCT